LAFNDCCNPSAYFERCIWLMRYICSEYIGFYNNETHQILENTLSCPYEELNQWRYIPLRKNYDPVTVSINASWNGISQTSSFNLAAIILKAEISTGLGVRNMFSPSDEYFLGISAGEPIVLLGNPYNHHIANEDKISIETISPIEYATFYDYRSEQRGANLLNLDHDEGALDIRVYMDGPIPTETDTLTIKVSCTDPNLTDVILKKTVFPPEYVFDGIPETIQPGDTVKLEIFYPIDDDNLEPLPDDQTYLTKIYKGTEYGRIYSEAEEDYIDENTLVPGPLYFIANDTIPDSSAIVRIRMEPVDELLPCSIKPDSGMPINSGKDNLKSGIRSSGSIKLTMPDVKNAAAGAAAEDRDYWPWFGAVEIKIGEIDSLDHFELKIIPDTLASQDTLAFTESAKLLVQAKNKDSVNIDLNENTLLKFSVITNPQFGTFINKDGDTLITTPVVLNDVRYGDAKTGVIKFAAVKTNPDSVVKCLLKVTMKNDSTKKGEREAVVLEQTLKIEMTGELEVQPIITSAKFDANTTAYLSSISDANRKEFRVKITRGGKIIGGHRFKLSTNYIDGSGGHDHTDPRRPTTGNDANQTERIKRQNYGSFYSYRSGPEFNTAHIQSTIEENSIVDSLLRFEYIASIWGDSMIVYLESIQNSLLKRDSIKIVEKIPDLNPLELGNDYLLVGGTDEHTNDHNHYGTNTVIQNIQNIATDWHATFPNEIVLQINDISLPYGGKFDVNGNWDGAHQTHREGNDIDIRTELHYYNEDGQLVHRQGIVVRNPRQDPFNTETQNLNPNSHLTGNRRFEAICIEHNGDASLHSQNSKYEHYHIDF